MKDVLYRSNPYNGSTEHPFNDAPRSLVLVLSLLLMPGGKEHQHGFDEWQEEMQRVQKAVCEHRNHGTHSTVCRLSPLSANVVARRGAGPA